MLKVRHICTDCGHQEICTLKGDFMKQLEKVEQNKGEDYFVIDVQCKHFITGAKLWTRGPESDKYWKERLSQPRSLMSEESGDFRDRESFPK